MYTRIDQLKLYTWPRSVGRSHLGVHHRQAVPQLQTWRSFLVRERWMAFLIHSWAGQKSQLLWILASGHFFDNLFCTFIALTIDFLNSSKKSGGSSFHVWFATTLTRSKISRCTQGHESLDLNTLTVLQVYAMVLPDHEINPRVPCTSNLLPRIDLTRLPLLKPLLNACKPDALALLKNCEKRKFKQIKL